MSNNNSSEDFWDLDDDDLDLESPSQDPTPSSEESGEPDPAPAEITPPEPAQEPAAQPDPEPVAEVAPSPEPAPEKRKEIKVKGKSKPILPKMSAIEMISVLTVLLILGGVAAWGISNFYKYAPNGDLITFDDDFPIKGESVTISELETWWRKPIREGEKTDRGVRLAINLIPCARIKVEDTQDSLLWVTFRNGDKNLVGDPINLAISNGKFLGSGSDEIEIHATSGFMNPSEINAYTNGDIDPWSVVIVEGNEGAEFSPDSEPFIKVMIEAKVPDKKEVE